MKELVGEREGCELPQAGKGSTGNPKRQDGGGKGHPPASMPTLWHMLRPPMCMYTQ